MENVKSNTCRAIILLLLSLGALLLLPIFTFKHEESRKIMKKEALQLLKNRPHLLQGQLEGLPPREQIHKQSRVKLCLG